jgi:hypothetical protein
MDKLTNAHINEIGRYFHPKSLIVDKKPDPKSVQDLTEILIENTDGTYNSYKMIAGKWIKTGTNLTE